MFSKVINQMCLITFSPWRIVDDCGGAFSMGAIGGAFFHSIKGYRNAPSVSLLHGCFSLSFSVCVCVCARVCVCESVRACVGAFMLYALNFDHMYL